MSTILKALKKAEASGDSKKAPFVRVSMSGERSRWLLVPVAVCVVVLGYFLAVYVLGPSSTVKTSRTVASFPGKADTAATGASTLNDQAMAYINAERYKEAEELLKEAIAKHPNDPYMRNHLGLAIKKQDRPTEAVPEYEKAIELKPDYYTAMNNLAVALEAAGNKVRAAELYEKTLAGDPAMSGAHLNYALMLENQGKLDEAESHYHTFLALSNDEDLKGLVKKRLKALR